jgi:hypothetical protein
MIARNKRPVRAAGRSTSGRLSQNRRKIVSVHNSYRAELRAGAFHPKMRNIIERSFNRLKDWRGIATRYDKKAANFLAGICLASVVTYWLQ